MNRRDLCLKELILPWLRHAELAVHKSLYVCKKQKFLFFMQHGTINFLCWKMNEQDRFKCTIS